jgi:transposase
VIAATIIAEIGVDVSTFHSASHLASWAGLCPGNHESAGRQRSGKTRKGNVYLKTAMVTAAITGGRKRGSYLADKYRRLRARRGAKRAAVAIAHKILVTAYHMLGKRSDYRELGAGYLDQLSHRRTASYLTRRLRDMGYDVQIIAKAT